MCFLIHAAPLFPFLPSLSLLDQCLISSEQAGPQAHCVNNDLFAVLHTQDLTSHIRPQSILIQHVAPVTAELNYRILFCFRLHFNKGQVIVMVTFPLQLQHQTL